MAEIIILVMRHVGDRRLASIRREPLGPLPYPAVEA